MKLDPKQLQRAMKQMGVQQEDIDAEEVIIRTADKDIIVLNPSVAIVKMMGQESFQISGDIEVRSREAQVTISPEDIKAVMEQAGVNEADARKALEASKGDIAQAIISLAE